VTPNALDEHRAVRARSVGTHAVDLGVVSAAAIGVMWPAIRHLGSRLPVGTEPVATVPRFNLWTLRWNSDRMWHGWSGYWDAPIFFPARGTFALSDPQPLTGLVFWLLRLCHIDPVAGYGLIVVATLVANGSMAMVLARRLGVGGWSRRFAGIALVVVPFAFNERGVLQLLALWPALWTLDRCITLARRPTVVNAVWLVLALGATFATSQYMGVFLALALVPAGGWWWWSHRSNASIGRWCQLALVVLIGCIVVVTPTWLQIRQSPTSGWSLATIDANSATWSEHLSLDRDLVGPTATGWLRSDPGRQRLWPGTLMVALACFGVGIGIGDRRRGIRADTELCPDLDGNKLDGRTMVGLLLVGAVGLALSFGLHLGIGPIQPYRWAVDHAGFDRLRSPFRAAALTQIVVMLVAAVGIDRLLLLSTPSPSTGERRATHACSKRLTSTRRRIVVAVVAILAVVEILPTTVPLSPAEPIRSEWEWVRFLETQPAGAVASVPTVAAGNQDAFESTTGEMLASLDHGHPLVGGYSGFFPESFSQTARWVRSIGSTESRRALLAVGVRYFVVDQPWAAVHPNQVDLLNAAPDLRKVFVDDLVQIFATVP